MLAYVTGKGRSSRLVHRLREQEQVVYSIDAWSYTPKLAGLFGISATYNPQEEEAALAGIEDEVASWHDTLFTEAELEKAKRMLLVEELGALRTMSGQARSYASSEFYAGDPLYGIRYLEKVRTATPEQVREVARNYLKLNKRTLAILSPETGDHETESARDETAIPLVERHVLANGVPLLVREDHRLPFVNICLAVRGGLLSETEQNNGVTALMSTLLTRGTASRSAAKIAQLVEERGGRLTPFSGRNSFGLQAFCLAEDAELFVELAADCLLHATFPEEELEKERAAQLAQVRQRQEDPMQLALEPLREALFAGHPYRFAPEGTEESVAGLSREALLAHREKLVSSGDMVISVFGDITGGEAASLVEEHFRGLPEPTGWQQEVAASPDLPAERTRREPREQAVLLMGYPGVDVADPRTDALKVVRDALSGLSSDLGIEVREKRGLVYYVGAFQLLGTDPGMFVLYAGTREEAVPEVKQLMHEQLERITSEGLREDELNRAVEKLVAEHQVSLQDNGGLAQTCALNELYGLGHDYIFRTEERLRGLTVEEIRAAAEDIFREEAEAVSVLLPETNVEPEEPTI